MAAPGENVSLRGSEEIDNWVKQEGNVWMAELDNSFFGDYNPYNINLSGSWLSYGRAHHVGEVYLNGKTFYEKFSLEEVKSLPNSWYTDVNEKTTRIWANFGWANPHKNLAEINVRECVIFPKKQGLKHIVIDGLSLAASKSATGQANSNPIRLRLKWCTPTWKNRPLSKHPIHSLTTSTKYGEEARQTTCTAALPAIVHTANVQPTPAMGRWPVLW